MSWNIRNINLITPILAALALSYGVAGSSHRSLLDAGNLALTPLYSAHFLILAALALAFRIADPGPVLNRSLLASEVASVLANQWVAVPVFVELLHPTDAQSALVLLLFPYYGIAAAAVVFPTAIAAQFLGRRIMRR